MLDISESGRQIGEKLYAVLNSEQKHELTQYVLDREIQGKIAAPVTIIPNHDLREHIEPALTELREGDLYFCLEQRIVSVCGQEIELTTKEFDILALLIMNPKRVFTYEMIIDVVWKEDLDYYSRKAVNNHVSNLRR